MVWVSTSTSEVTTPTVLITAGPCFQGQVERTSEAGKAIAMYDSI